MGAIVEEKIQFQDGVLRLSGVLGYPEEADLRRGVLLCSPHPHFAGNMDNNVVCAVAKKFAQDAAVLRFDYRGVGQSQIMLAEGDSVFDYWEQVETSKDYSDAMDDVDAAFKALDEMLDDSESRYLLAGYSFGAAAALKYGMNVDRCDVLVGMAPPLGKVDFSFLEACDKPCLLLMGKDDFLYSPDELEKLKSFINKNVTIEILERCDHFFRGDEEMIAQLVQDFVSRQAKLESA